MSRKAAVSGIAGEERIVAEVLPIGDAVGTAAAGVSKPWNADAAPTAGPRHHPPVLDDADNLMAGYDGQLRIRQLAVHHMQVGAADRAGFDTHQDFARSWLGGGPFFKLQRLADFMQDHHFHE